LYAAQQAFRGASLSERANALESRRAKCRAARRVTDDAIDRRGNGGRI
jgi:hypothetical protein